MDGFNVYTKRCKNKENAEKFLNFLLEEDVIVKNTMITSALPARMDVIKKTSRRISKLSTYTVDFSKLPDLEFFRNPGEFIQIYDDMWTDIINK